MPFSGSTLTSFFRSRTVLIALGAVIALAVAGTTVGYATLGSTVTLSLDGQAEEVRTSGDTVAEVLEDEGVEVGEHDIVAPGLDEQVEEGDKIAVRFGRPLELTVDGEPETHWVNSTQVSSALAEIGSTYRRADLSTSRSMTIGRDGAEIEVVTPKKLTFTLAGKKPVKREVTALTVRDALAEMDVKVDKHDVTKPALGKRLDDGDKVTFDDIEVDRKRFKAEAIQPGTIEREDDSMTEGTTEVVRAGEAGVRDVTYRLTTRNGEVVKRKVLRADVKREPVDEIIVVGTAEVAAPNYASGGTVWDSLAQCESGGNWSITTGNGYYGGLQFSLSTWQAYGGTGLPSQHSRETQIAIATKLRDATGGYGSWPGCAASLGLPT